MSDAEKLGQEEEVLWRSLGRLVHVLPRLLDEDLVRACGLSATEYAVLVNLDEAPGRGLRITELAAATALSRSPAEARAATSQPPKTALTSTAAKPCSAL